jgi:cellobiose phosphorylase
LQVDPSIPKTWDGYTVTREFRGERYQITIKNPNHVSMGVAKMTVDGKEVEGNIIPFFGDKKVHTVEVVLG